MTRIGLSTGYCIADSNLEFLGYSTAQLILSNYTEKSLVALVTSIYIV